MSEEDEKQARYRSQAVGCLSVVMMVVAAPSLVLGILIYASASDSAEAHSGVGGALSGLGEIVGIGVIAFAAIVLVIGAALYIRSAKD